MLFYNSDLNFHFIMKNKNFKPVTELGIMKLSKSSEKELNNILYYFVEEIDEELTNRYFSVKRYSNNCLDQECYKKEFKKYIMNISKQFSNWDLKFYTEDESESDIRRVIWETEKCEYSSHYFIKANSNIILVSGSEIKYINDDLDNLMLEVCSSINENVKERQEMQNFYKFMEDMSKEAEALSKQENISLSEALEVVYKKYNFDWSW